MTDVEAPAHLADHEGPKKKKSDSLGIELLKSKCAPAGRLQKRTARSSTSPNPAPLIRQARKEKPHVSDDDEDDENDHIEDHHNEEEDGGEEETSTVATSSSSSVTTHTADDDEEEDEGEEIEEDEKEGRCYAFDMHAGAGEEDEDEEEEGEVDEEDDDEDDDESESYDTTEGTENTFDNADDDEGEDDDDHSQAKAFETINAVTGVVGRPRLAKLKLPLREANDASSEPVSSPRGFSSPRAFYSPRPMMMPMTPHSKAAALSVTSRERLCDVELVVEEGQRMVAAGSIQGLVDKLVSIDEGIVDFDLSYYTSVFLITHPMFITTTELLQRLFDAAEAPAEPFPGGTDDPRVLQQRVRTRVLEVIKKWAEEFFSDFKAGCEAREHLDAWLAKQTKDHDTGDDLDEANDQQSQLLKKIQALLSSNDLIQKHMVPVAPTPPPAAMAAHANDPDKLPIPLPPPPPVDDLSRFCVLDFPPAKIAQQLTYIDFQMFSAVRFSEFFHCAWSKKDCELRAPNLVRLIDRFNRVSQWIQTSIVRVRDLKKRVAVLSRFIHIAQEFEWLHNFQGMMMVNAALNNSAISRLKHTWAALGQEDKERFDSIQTFFSPYHNYASYRQKLRTSVPPIVPFMALFLTDLTFIDENEDKVARKKATSDAAAKEDTELDAKEAHDERTSAQEEAHPHADAAEQPAAESDVTAAAASSAETGSIEAVEEEVKDLVNFQKMELVGKVLLNVKKFQKATYKNLIPSAPFQKFFGEITEVPMPAPEEIAREKKKDDLYAPSCLMWSLDSIYKYSLIIEPRDGKPPKTKSAKPKKARASSTAPASLENSPVKPKKEPSRKTSANSKKYATMGRASKRPKASPDATLTIQQNPLLMQLQSRNLAQRRQSRSGSIDASSPIVAAVTATATAAAPNVPQPPPAPVVVVNPLLAAAAAAKKERSYSMPPIILEKSASLSALRKYRDEKEDELAAAGGGGDDEPPPMMLKKAGKKKSMTMMTLASSTPETPTPPSPLSAPMMVVSESGGGGKRRASATEKKEKKDKKDKKDKREKGSKLMGSMGGGAPGELRQKKKSARDLSKSNLLADL